MLSCFFKATAAVRTIRHVCQARLVIQSKKGQRIPSKPPGERELGVVQEAQPGAQFKCERISSIDQPNRSTRGSEAEPTTRSQYSSFRDWERSLDPRRLQRALRHSRTNIASSFSLGWPSALGSDLSRGKVSLAFCLHTVSFDKNRPDEANQWFSRSGIPRPLLRERWQQTCLQTIGLRPPQSSLERDRWSASRWFLGRGRTDKRSRIKGKM